MSTRAPICHIPPANPVVPQPGPQNLPSIPVATDMASALAAINALRTTIKIITNQWTPNIGNNFNTKPDPNKKVQWSEQSRVVDTVRIYQNNDPSTGNFVEVEQINRLVMADKNTGQTWSWDRERR